MIDNYSFWRSQPIDKDFELEIVSLHKDSHEKPLCKYNTDNINTIGVLKNEPFEIRFHNRSKETVTVRITLDGIDCLSGKPGDLSIDHDMWLVNAGKTLTLKAWHETNAGGSQFVFADENKGVALHTSGDVSHKGMIAAAVFTENRAYRIAYADYYFDNININKSRLIDKRIEEKTKGLITKLSDNTRISETKSVTYSASGIDIANIADSDVSDTLNIDHERSSASIGAGAFVEQKTRHVRGLTKPELHSVIRMRYMYWDALVTKLKDIKPTVVHPTGFPGDKQKLFTLSHVPKADTSDTKMTQSDIGFERTL